MANLKDEMVIKTIQQIITEIKEEIKEKKVITEGRTPQKIFEGHRKNLKNYILKNVLEAIDEAHKK